MRSSSLKIATEHGVSSPRAYRDALIHDWFLSNEDKCTLETFFLAKEYSQELKDHIKNGAFWIDNKEYHITWIHKPETVFKAEFALLSFRYCKLLNCGYVLIKELSPEDNPNSFNFVEYQE